MKYLAVVFSFFVFFVQPATSQEVDENKLALAKRIIELTRATEAIEKMMPAMMEQQMAGMRSSGKIGDLSDAQQVALKKAIDQFTADFTVAFEPLLEEMTVLYAQKFSKEDLQGLIEFYESDLGQRFAQGGIELGAEVALKSQTWAQSHIIPVAQKFSRNMQAVLAMTE
ncbi:MAG: DUF2059 domain-containing protein [Kordiimonadaceae bacterium]|nr:DUF2059 domain-containing protein [Kordiimonadaceae bacterium]MBO6567892.1 DUF2059 domain-containing protein [Kordiimonadaceae bacterium]MBO6964378.1 DUF2059 domain-containing protein [Kordiimonadaceae bacterium]